MRHKHFFTVANYAITVSVFLLLGSVREANAFTESDLLERQIKATSIKGESIDQALDLLAVEYRIPIGIELGDPKLNPLREIDVELPKTTVKGFLEAVTAKDPRFIWKLEGGVIHLYPVSGRDVLVLTLLEAKISHFAFTGPVSWYHIHYEILNLPEIKSQLVVAGVDAMMFHNFGNMHKLEKGIFFSESNLTLRELLDRIVLKTEIKRWVLTRWGENSEYITLRS